jgi:hypothetical protein
LRARPASRPGRQQQCSQAAAGSTHPAFPVLRTAEHDVVGLSARDVRW